MAFKYQQQKKKKYMFLYVFCISIYNNIRIIFLKKELMW